MKCAISINSIVIGGIGEITVYSIIQCVLAGGSRMGSADYDYIQDWKAEGLSVRIAGEYPCLTSTRIKCWISVGIKC
jgi:hypothetical protein